MSDYMNWDAISREISMDLEEDSVLEQRQAPLDATAIPEVLWDLLDIDARSGFGVNHSLLDWPSSTGINPGKRYNLPPQSLWALEQVRLKAMRTRQTRKKLAIQEISICLMIHHLLAQANAHLISEDDFTLLSPHIRSVALFTSHESQSWVRRIRTDIKSLEVTKIEEWPEDESKVRMSPGLPAEPGYMQDKDGDFHHIARQLNLAIRKIFDDYQDKRTKPDESAVAVAKICHNLLVSSAAPDLQTFNILLTGFQKWKRPDLIDTVIHALDNCKIRPNEITCAAILDQYTETQRPDHFSRFVAKMRGANSHLMLAHPDVTVNEASQGRLIRTSETKVFQKVYPTPMVFHSLMRGVLAFAGFDRAMDIYYEMKADGWGLDVSGLSRFLDDCVQRGDWAGGLAVWEEIASIPGRVRPALLTKAYAQFLTLCSVAQKPAAFNSVLNDVVQRGYDRKAILREVRARTYAARREKGYLAPAWTADNLLIAVSEYMKEEGKGGEVDGKAETAELFEEMGAMRDPGEGRGEEDTAVNTEGAWDAWLEYELGDVKGEAASRKKP